MFPVLDSEFIAAFTVPGGRVEFVRNIVPHRSRFYLSENKDLGQRREIVSLTDLLMHVLQSLTINIADDIYISAKRMRSQDDQTGLLRTWKEISAYLRCDVRTCCRWEKFGLPIHRVDGAPKSSVFAFKSELDRWISHRSGDVSIEKPRKSKNKYILLIIVIIPTLLSLLVIAYVLVPRPLTEMDFHIQDSHFIIQAASGKEIWRYDTGLSNLAEESTYRLHYQFKRRNLDDSPLLPHIIIRDINHDGKSEVLFSIQTEDEFREGLLICFDSLGRILWQFQAGRQLQFGTESFSSDYRIAGFDIQDLNDDGNYEIVVLSIHKPFFPSQLAVLDITGRVIGEFWNSGHLSDFALADLNDDGRKEILVTGFNNEYKKGCFIVFDSMKIFGSSPQLKATYRSSGLGPGSENYYALFPQVNDKITPMEQDTLETVFVLKDKMISLRTWPSCLYFEFNSRLDLLDVKTSDRFDKLLKQAQSMGKVPAVIDESFFKSLAENILVFEHNVWAPLGQSGRMLGKISK